MNNNEDSIEFQEEGRTQKPAYGLGYFGHLDPEPRLVLVYLAGFSILLAGGALAWAGWSWLALLLAVLAVAVLVSALAYLLKRNRQPERSSTPEWR